MIIPRCSPGSSLASSSGFGGRSARRRLTWSDPPAGWQNPRSLPAGRRGLVRARIGRQRGRPGSRIDRSPPLNTHPDAVAADTTHLVRWSAARPVVTVLGEWRPGRSGFAGLGARPMGCRRVVAGRGSQSDHLAQHRVIGHAGLFSAGLAGGLLSSAAEGDQGHRSWSSVCASTVAIPARRRTGPVRFADETVAAVSRSGLALHDAQVLVAHVSLVRCCPGLYRGVGAADGCL